MRLTSVGENRNGSSKLVGNVGEINFLDDLDESVITPEDTAAIGNVLDNTDNPDGPNDASVTTFQVAGDPTVYNAGETATIAGVGTLVINSGGSYIFTPEADYDGAVPQTSYNVTDGEDTVISTLDISITPENDKPVANDDSFFVELGDMALVDVTANDTDVDGTVEPSTLVFGTPSLGTAVVEQDQFDQNKYKLKYTASPSGFSYPDSIDDTNSSKEDIFSYTVDDNNNATSDPGTITAKVIDPLRETSTDSRNATLNNQLITLELSTEDRTFNDSSFVSSTITFGALYQSAVNISFVLDGSGSIGATDYDTQVAAVQKTIGDLRTQFGGTGTDVEIQLVQFSGDQNTSDPTPEAFSERFNLFDMELDDVNTDTPLRPYLSEFTNYEAGLDEAVDFFTGQSGDENIMLFVSDGLPNRAVDPNNSGQGIASSNSAFFTDEVNQLKDVLGVSITAIGFGSGINTTTLDLIDNTGGSEVLNSVDELEDALGASPLFPADVIDFSLTVNGVIDPNVSVANLVDLGGGDLGFEATLMGLDNSLGATNQVIATAEFDINGDNIADEIRTAETFINGTDGTDITFI